MYTIAYERDYGMFVVRLNGVKVGQSQTEAGCRLIRRNHRQSR